jgi:hypothetical protein
MLKNNKFQKEWHSATKPLKKFGRYSSSYVTQLVVFSFCLRERGVKKRRRRRKLLHEAAPAVPLIAAASSVSVSPSLHFIIYLHPFQSL